MVYYYRHEVKLIDCSDGSMVKLFVNMADPSQAREITQFKLDKRHRKCYVGDSHVIRCTLTHLGSH